MNKWEQEEPQDRNLIQGRDRSQRLAQNHQAGEA